MEEFKNCCLCNEVAEIKTAKGTGGNRFIINCAGFCPIYEISRTSIKELQNKPHRRQAIIEKIKAFNKEDPNDMPVIRMVNASYDMVVTTRGREAELK